MKEFEKIRETSREMKWYNADFTILTEKAPATSAEGGRRLHIDVRREYFKISEIAECEFENSLESAWSDEQASSFIESMFLGISVPQLYLKNSKTEKRQIIDGVNRITAIQRFVKGDLVLAPEGISLLECLKGTSFSEVPLYYTRRFMDIMLRAVIIESDAPNEMCEIMRSKLNENR